MPFARMIERLFSHPAFRDGPAGARARYYPAQGEARDVRAIVVGQADEVAEFGRIGAQVQVITIDIPASDLADLGLPPGDGDRIAVGDRVHVVKSASRDALRLVWRFLVTEVEDAACP